MAYTDECPPGCQACANIEALTDAYEEALRARQALSGIEHTVGLGVSPADIPASLTKAADDFTPFNEAPHDAP